MRNLFGYEVLDSGGEKLGTVENAREGGKGIPGFLEISTGWLGLGKTRLVPEAGAAVDHGAQTMRIAHDRETVESSPEFEPSGNRNRTLKSRFLAHYRIEAGSGTASPAPAKRFPVQPPDAAAAVHMKEGQALEVPLAEERVLVTKRGIRLGEVRLRKVVRTEIVHQPVELRREEVIVERLSPDGVWEAEGVLEGKTLSIPLSREEAVIEKSVRSAGAVKVSKVTKVERKTVSGAVRREEVEVERFLTKKADAAESAAAKAGEAKSRGKKRRRR